MAGDASSLRSQPRKLSPLAPEEIKYLVLEGGGGKGFAYLGAIEVLEKLKVTQNCKGFGGASAGAITALLLSLGMTAADIQAYMLSTNFDSFFDPVSPRKMPLAGAGAGPVEDNERERQWLAGIQQIADGLRLLRITADPLTLATTAIREEISPSAIISRWVEQHVASLPAPFPQLIRDWARYLAYLPRDMGLFSGEAARQEFDRLIRTRYAAKKQGLPSSFASVTFRQHYEVFQKKLLLTGTNLRSGRTQLFSHDDTPDFPVADAVRISMSLPWIYKPYVITDRSEGWPECGVYVDGGVWNNLPYREFDGEGAAARQQGNSLRGKRGRAVSTRQTLGLRLAVDPVPEITNVFDLSLQMLKSGAVGNGESQVLDKHADQTIVLDTQGLDLINFNPDPAVREKVQKRAKRTALRYFSLQDLIDVEAGLRDDQDDLDAYLRRYQASSCEPVDVDALRQELQRAGLL